jgi:hypothetical protein
LPHQLEAGTPTTKYRQHQRHLHHLPAAPTSWITPSNEPTNEPTATPSPLPTIAPVVQVTPTNTTEPTPTIASNSYDMNRDGGERAMNYSPDDGETGLYTTIYWAMADIRMLGAEQHTSCF